jgi:hypothetical protein
MGWTLAEATSLLTDVYTGQTLHVAALDTDVAISGNFTVNTSTSVITSAVTINFVEGTRITFLAEGGGTLPSGLNDINTFFATNISGNTFQVKAAISDPDPVEITDTGSGTYTFSDAPPLPYDNVATAAWIRYEIAQANYPSNARLSWVVPSPITIGSPASEAQVIGTATLQGNMEFTALVFIHGGSSSPGNTTGTIVAREFTGRIVATNASPKTSNLKIAIPISQT